MLAGHSQLAAATRTTGSPGVRRAPGRRGVRRGRCPVGGHCGAPPRPLPRPPPCAR